MCACGLCGGGTAAMWGQCSFLLGVEDFSISRLWVCNRSLRWVVEASMVSSSEASPSVG